ncbi:MAG TPA: MFS transporter [Candidatus Angelobacter sp.]|nr:MFS transporter [Candidatus Angelobacter sp.]
MATPDSKAASVAEQPSLLGRFFCSSNLVLLMVCLMYGLTYIDRINVNTAGPSIQKDLHLNTYELGWVFSAFGWAYLVLQVWGGWLSDRFGARRALTVCGIIWAGSTMLMGLVGSFTGLILCRVLLGLGEGATFPTATRALADWFPAEKRGFAQGITHSFARLGNFFTPPLVAFLIRLRSWRLSFVVLGGVSLLWSVAWWFYFRDDPSTHRGITQWELARVPKYTAKKDRKKDPVPWKALAFRMAPVTLVYFCYGWTLWLYLTWLPSFFMHGYKLDLKKSALFSSGVFLAGVIGDTVGGLVSDRILIKTGDRNKARRNLVIAGFLLSLLFMIPVLRSHDLNTVALCLSAAFFFAEFTIGPFWAIPMDIAPRFSGSASGLMNVGSALAAAVSPLVAGYVIQKTGNWSLPFLGSIGLLLFGAFMAYWMKPNEPLPGTELGAVARPVG